MSKKYSLNQLRNILKIGIPTIEMYLCRAEFSHVKKIKGVYINITPNDIQRLKTLTNRRFNKNDKEF